MSINLMIVALVAIVSVQQVVLAQKDIYQLCSQFDRELKEAVKGITDQDVNYNKAQELLLGKDAPLDWRLRQKLAVSWESIRLDKGANCDTIGHRSVALIRECRPLDFEHLKATLGADVQAFIQMCSCDNLWWPELNMALEKIGSARANVENFLNSDFIEEYAHETRQTNGGADIRLATSSTILDPSLVGKSGLTALVRVYKLHYPKDSINGWREYFKKKPSAMGRYVRRWLIKPCAKYVKAAGPLIESALDHAQLHAKGESDFLSGQAELFKDSMFRYEFCSRLAMDLVRDNFIKAIRDNL